MMFSFSSPSYTTMPRSKRLVRNELGAFRGTALASAISSDLFFLSLFDNTHADLICIYSSNHVLCTFFNLILSVSWYFHFLFLSIRHSQDEIFQTFAVSTLVSLFRGTPPRLMRIFSLPMRTANPSKCAEVWADPLGCCAALEVDGRHAAGLILPWMSDPFVRVPALFSPKPLHFLWLVADQT